MTVIYDIVIVLMFVWLSTTDNGFNHRSCDRRKIIP
jgi:hypothetical protein